MDDSKKIESLIAAGDVGRLGRMLLDRDIQGPQPRRMSAGQAFAMLGIDAELPEGASASVLDFRTAHSVDRNADDRVRAARALGRIKDKNAALPLIDGLDDPNPEVASAAIGGLRGLAGALGLDSAEFEEIIGHGRQSLTPLKKVEAKFRLSNLFGV